MSERVCLSRRQLIGGAVAVGVCAPMVAACGPEEKAQVPPPGTDLADIADVPVAGGLILSKQNVVITQPAKGEFEAFEATCTHARCIVTSVDTTINCKCHGSKFSTTDGAVTRGPATQALPPVKITVKAGTITTA